MIVLKTAIITAVLVALTSAWSTQFPQIFRTFPPPPPLPQYRQFFQDPAMFEPRFYVHHQPQFRHPLHLYQPPLHPQPSPPPPPPQPPQPPAARLPTPQDLLATSPAGATDVHHHHHHHVFHYYYLPTVDGAAGGRNELGRNLRQPCDPASPGPPSHLPPPQSSPPQPGYLPPPSPSPPTPTPTTAAPPAAQPPCDHDDDAVVVDNLDYFPFGRSPIVVATSSAAATSVNKDRERSGDGSRQDGRSRQNFVGRQENRSNFILANYLLPPDK